MHSLEVVGNTVATMTSLDLLDIINRERMAFGEDAVRRNDFNARVEDELAGDHYETFVVKNQNGTASSAFLLTLDQCMLVAMRESKGVRRNVLIELKAKNATPAIPQSLSAALRLAADQAEQIEQQQAQLAIAAPKAHALDRIALSDGSLCLTDAAKTLQVQPRKFTQLLQEKGWLYRRPTGAGWLAYQDRIQQGVLEHKTTTGEKSDGSEWTGTQVRVTAKGLAKLAVVLGGEAA